MSVTGTGIRAGTTITAINSTTSITISQNASATHAADSLTFTDQSFWVYGVETPRLVINEVYPRFDTYATAATHAITGASNTSPIDITTAASTVGLVNGATVTISGVKGNTAANGTWTIAGLTATSFQLVGSTGNGKYTVGSGTWTGSFNANFWVEFYNPFPTTASYGTAPNSITDNATYSTDTTAYINSASYQLVIIDNNNAPVPVATQLQNKDNTLGNPLGNLSNLVLTGHTTRNSNTITGLASTSNLYVGMTVTGTGIPNGTTITSIASATSITISQNATATSPAIGVSLTMALNPAVTPLGTAPANPSSYYVLGPTAAGYSGAGTLTSITSKTNHTTTEMSIPASFPTAKYTLLLQRLLNPCLPLNTTTTSPLYNPFITVDYIDGITCNNAVAPAALPPPASQGRAQPWAGNTLAAQHTASVPAGGPKNTFGAQNDNAPANYDWLVHPDRALISKAELLGVPSCKPHELTQLVVPVRGTITAASTASPIVITTSSTTGLVSGAVVTVAGVTGNTAANGTWTIGTVTPTTFQLVGSTGSGAFTPGGGTFTTPQRHLTPWLGTLGMVPPDGKTRLSRFFELADVAPRMNGLASEGRIPGRINLNTAPDQTILQAIADPQPGNWYNATNAPQLTTNPGGYLSGLVIGGQAPTATSVPYWPFGVAPATGTDAISSVARGITSTQNSNLMNTNTVFAGGTPPTNPYQLYELYNKMLNNTTTRSNVFAVWLTVGFFQVDANNLLMGEINAAQGRAIRHRMFAIVDRTQLTAFSTTANITAAIPATGPNFITATVFPPGTQVTNANTGRPVTLQAGMTVVVEPGGANEETVVLGANLSATFYKSHNGTVKVIGRGNPGPWTTYDIRQDPSVVPYYAIIE